MAERRYARTADSAWAGATVLALTALLACSTAARSQTSEPPRVSVGTGTVEGVREGRLAVFRGLPYAAAPVGPLRWRAPEPPPPWPDVRRADAFGPACPQDRTASVDQAGDPGPTSEDCLFLNVWTPRADAQANAPVMVWLHGGAFVIGAGSQALYDGSALARRGVVVVTLNYRLGRLGFFSHPALDAAAPNGPVNFGLLDQLAALHWVREHIAAFGGDPSNITVFGESAGAQSVLALFASPLAKGLFRRGIAQSPYGVPSRSRAQARADGVATATALGFDGVKATLEQLRSVPADVVVAAESAGGALLPGPIVGDAVLPLPILTTVRQGREAALPLVVGSNSDDGNVAFAFGVDPAALVRRLGAARIAVRALYPSDLDDAQLGRNVARDVVFTAFARRIAWLHSARAPTWRYHYSRVPTNATDLWTGVPHGGEIAPVFGVDDACGCLPAPQSDDDRVAARIVGDYWTAFALDGSPQANGAPAWPRDGRRDSRTLEFADEPVVRMDFMKTRLNAFIAALNLAGLFAGR